MLDPAPTGQPAVGSVRGQRVKPASEIVEKVEKGAAAFFLE